MSNWTNRAAVFHFCLALAAMLAAVVLMALK